MSRKPKLGVTLAVGATKNEKKREKTCQFPLADELHKRTVLLQYSTEQYGVITVRE